MKGHATMGFFSRLMGGSDKQTTAASEFEILAPVSGELVNLEKTNDPAFSSRAVGDGVAVVPQEGTVLLFPAPSRRCFRLSTRWASCPTTALLR